MVEAIASDYRFYSQTLNSQNTTVTEEEGGTPVKAAVPAPIGGGSSQNFSVVNGGTVITHPTFTIRGSGTNFLVQNITTGESFNLNLTLLNNETVVINTYNRTAFKGTQNVFGSFDGDWMTLAKGTNIIVFNAQSGIGVNTRLTVEWRDAFLGL